MKKRYYLLIIFPLWGSVILFIILFVKSIKRQANKENVIRFFIFLALTAVLCMFAAAGFVNLVDNIFISNYYEQTDLLTIIELIVMFTIGGWLTNVITILRANEKWWYLVL